MVKHLWRGDIRADFRKHTHFPGKPAPFFHIAGRAGGCDIFPVCLATETARQYMIEGQFLRRAAILAPKTVTQEDIEPGEGRLFALLDIALKADDAGHAHFEARRSNDAIIFRDDVDPFQKNRFKSILPGPKR